MFIARSYAGLSHVELWPAAWNGDCVNRQDAQLQLLISGAPNISFLNFAGLQVLKQPTNLAA